MKSIENAIENPSKNSQKTRFSLYGPIKNL